jgi:hypothetical protein
MMRQLLAVVGDWFYGGFDRISTLVADDPDYPDDGDPLASALALPAWASNESLRAS